MIYRKKHFDHFEFKQNRLILQQKWGFNRQQQARNSRVLAEYHYHRWKTTQCQ